MLDLYIITKLMCGFIECFNFVCLTTIGGTSSSVGNENKQQQASNNFAGFHTHTCLNRT